MEGIDLEDSPVIECKLERLLNMTVRNDWIRTESVLIWEDWEVRYCLRLN